jgi:hypothetical protein
VVIVTEGAEFCPHHRQLAEEFGTEMVRSGAVPKKRALPVVEESPDGISMRPVWLTLECPNCGERSRAPELLVRVRRSSL